ncbi:MAG: peptidylprolyl isomerase [Acidobacteria bacterium]|nr:peptidylprolyl isomerase [Acidobacteriota bacterium]
MNSFRRYSRLSVFIIAAGFICAGSMIQAGPLQPQDAETQVSASGGQDANQPAGTNTSKSYQNLFPDVVATVNGEPIPGRELERAVSSEMASMGNPEWKNLREDYRGNLVYSLISGLINSQLMYAEAVSNGIYVSDSEVQDEYQRISKSFKNDQEMKAFLADQNMSSDEMIENIHRALVVTKYVDEVIGSKLTVTLEEMKAFYSGNPDQFRYPDLVRTSHIQVDAGKNQEEDALARQRIDDLMARVSKGEDFAVLAQEHSTSPSAGRGGDIGYAAREMLPDEYAEAAFSLPVGESRIVKTQEGYFIVKVTGKKKEGMSTFDESKEQIAEFLKNEKTQKELQKRINQLRDAAEIEFLIPAGPPLEP